MTQRLTHPDSENGIEVREDQVSAYLGQGWRKAEAPSVDAPAVDNAPVDKPVDSKPATGKK